MSPKIQLTAIVAVPSSSAGAGASIEILFGVVQSG